MFRLTREVRFAINHDADDQLDAPRPTNGYGGFPSLNLEQIDFLALYRAELARRQAAASPAQA